MYRFRFNAYMLQRIIPTLKGPGRLSARQREPGPQTTCRILGMDYYTQQSTQPLRQADPACRKL